MKKLTYLDALMIGVEQRRFHMGVYFYKDRVVADASTLHTSLSICSDFTRWFAPRKHPNITTFRNKTPHYYCFEYFCPTWHSRHTKAGIEPNIWLCNRIQSTDPLSLFNYREQMFLSNICNIIKKCE